MKSIKIIMFFFALFLVFTSIASATTYHKNSQDITAYVAPSGNKTYHGTTPYQYRTAAVHPKTCGKPTSGTIYPYGATIITDSNLQLTLDKKANLFTVEDMGDVYCDRGFTSYWFDIYFGTDTIANKANATNFGQKKMGYNVIY